MQLGILKSAGDIKKNKICFQTPWEKSIARGNIKQMTWSRKRLFTSKHCLKNPPAENITISC